MEELEVVEEGALDPFNVPDLSFAESDSDEEGESLDDEEDEEEADVDDVMEVDEEPEQVVKDAEGNVILRKKIASKITRKRKAKYVPKADHERKRKPYRSARDIAKEAAKKKTGALRKGPKYFALSPEFKADRLSATLQGAFFRLSFKI